MKLGKKNIGFLKTVVDQSWDEVLIADLDAKTIVYANKTARRNLKLEKGPISLSLDTILDPEYFDQIIKDISQVDSYTMVNHEIRLRRMDNSTFPAWVKSSLTLVDNHPLLILNCRDITEKRKTERELSYLSNFDALTGLANRNLFIEQLKSAMEHTQRNNSLSALLYLDLNGFKSIIDRHGHELGDRLLREVGKRLLRNVRKTDIVARLGGDEFALILSHINTVDSINHVVETLLKNLKKPFTINGSEICTSASIGITIFPFNDKEDCYDLLRQADAAMYKAKESDRSCIAYYSVDISLAELRKNKLETALRTALQKKEFEIYYQPRVELVNGHIVGAEALLRWMNPELGFVSPVEFIPILESIGLINEVGQWVLESGCLQLKEWTDKGFNLRLSINVSGQQFASGNFAEVLDEAIRKSNVLPNCLEMEITEGVLINNQDEASATLAEIRRKGVKVSLDDFGTGYSSLTYLKKFPIDILKIDRSFVMDLVQNFSLRYYHQNILYWQKI